jgi:hypothetical protein
VTAVTTDPLVALLTRTALMLRGSVAVFATVAAILSAGPNHSWAGTAIALCALDVATVAYVLLVRARGLGSAVIVADVLVVTALALALRWLMPAASASSTAGWVFTAVSIVVIVAQFGGRPVWTVPAGVLAAVAFLAGARLAGAPDGGVPAAFTLVLQVAITAGFIAVLRRAGRRAQAAAQEYHDTVREQQAARLRRDAERTELTLLHNGPLTTLTLVAQGGLSTRTILAVRAQAAVDLAVLGAEAGPPGPGEVVQLADLLERTVAIIRHRLTVRLTAGACLLPAPVAQALAGATAEALENVVRHSGTDTATVHSTGGGRAVTVTITDGGRGFDPAAVPAERFGLRESIIGQVARVGGRTRVTSRPGHGTTVALVWPA